MVRDFNVSGTDMNKTKIKAIEQILIQIGRKFIEKLEEYIFLDT